MPPEAAPRRLYREPDDKMVAGVCSGLGDSLGIDPSILRLGVILFGLMTGVGFLGYLVAAIVIPSRPAEVPRVQAPPRLRPDHASNVVAVGLLMVIALVLFHRGFWWDGPIVGLLLLVFGAWLLLGDGYRPLTTGDITQSGDTARADATTVTPEAASPHAIPSFGDAAGDTAEGLDHATRILPSVPDDSAVSADPQGEVPPPLPPWGVGSRSAGTDAELLPSVDRTWGAVFAVICIVAGVVALLELLDVVDLTFSTAVAGMVLAIGVAMVVGAWHGRRGRWLIFLGAPAVALLVGDDLMNVPLDAGMGDRTLVVDLDHLATSDRELAIGELTLDLSQVDPQPGEVPEISAEVGIGHLLVVLPDDMTATVDARSRVGNIAADRVSDSDGGLDLRRRFTMQGRSDPQRETPRRRVDLDLRVGVGGVEVRYE